MTDEICPSCGQKSLFKTIYGWWKCRHCFYSGKRNKEKTEEKDLKSLCQIEGDSGDKAI